MADAADLKSAEGFLLYGFESRLRHHQFRILLMLNLKCVFVCSRSQEIGRFRRFEAHVLACDRVTDVEFPCVQHLTLRLRVHCPVRDMASIYGIADYGTSK